MPCRNDFYCSVCNCQHDYCCPRDSRWAGTPEALREPCAENINDLLSPTGGSKSSPPPSVSLLCEALEIIEAHGLLSYASECLKQWHEDHDEFEKDRLKLEAAEKLSAKERRLLGIDLEALKRNAK